MHLTSVSGKSGEAQGIGILAYYQQELRKEEAAAEAAKTADPHHPVEYVLLGGAKMPRTLFERAQAEGAAIRDV